MARMTHGPDADGYPGRWQPSVIITTGNHTFRTIAHLRTDIELTDRQRAYGLVSTLVGTTLSEVERLKDWQDQKASDYDDMQRDGIRL